MFNFHQASTDSLTYRAFTQEMSEVLQILNIKTCLMAFKYVEIFYPNDGVIPNYAIISGEIQRDLGRRFSVRIAPLDLEDKKEFL